MQYKNKIKFMFKTSKIFHFYLFFSFLFLYSCSQTQNEINKFSPKSSFGYLVTEEPQASLVGIDILKKGGSAADAVVASFFMLSVTYPVAAGLGSGGVCIVHNRLTGTSESIDFRNIPILKNSIIGVPRAVRALSGMQARYGKLKWSTVVLPSERLARFGFQASRATSNIAKNFSRLSGKQNFIPFVVDDLPINEGEIIVQNDLADTLSSIRLRGGGDLYFGDLGKKFYKELKKYGLKVNFEMLRDFQPFWQDTNNNITNKYTILSPLEGTTGTKSSEYIIRNLIDNDEFKNSNEQNKYLILAEFTGKALYSSFLDDFSSEISLQIGGEELENIINKSSLPDLSMWKNAGHDGTTSIIATDKFGQSIACVFSMGSPFGIGKQISGLGFSPGLAFSDDKTNWLESGIDFMSPLIITDNYNKEVIFIIAGTKGPSTVSSVSSVVLNTLSNNSLDKSINMPRVYFPFNPNELWLEDSINNEFIKLLKKNKISYKKLTNLGHINAIYCPNSSLDLLSCEYISDPRGSGLALSGELF